MNLSNTKTADSLVTENKSLPRYNLNNSIINVTSPIGTATSFKSQNSQQAGPNPDEIVVSQTNIS
jgi:hypothetical protein